jgi:Holliday junction resolvasome RuvABC endonuclease subunit
MVIGIDYSLTSPAMCIMAEPNINKCVFYYLTTNKKLVGNFDNAIGYHHKEYYIEQERYDNIAEFFIGKIPTKPLPQIFIEDYSFGSTGKVFHIAENTGLLKYKLWEVGYKFSTIPPTVIKKFATGKGNADKAKMYESFFNETNRNFENLLNRNLTLGSPVTDIVDAYYIAKYGYDQVYQKGAV